MPFKTARRALMLGVSLLTTALATDLAAAPVGRPVISDQAAKRPISRDQRLTVMKPELVHLLKPAPVPWLLAKVIKVNDMTGWTQLTNGASKGGPSVFQSSAVKTGTGVAVRGADDNLYFTTIDPLNPGGPIDTGAWVSMKSATTSEPQCQSGNVTQSTSAVFCAWLGGAGNAMWGLYQYDYLTGYDMGGHAAGARPTLIYADEMPIYEGSTLAGFQREVKMGVWAGAKLFVRYQKAVYLQQLVTVPSQYSPYAQNGTLPQGMKIGDNITSDGGWVVKPTPYYSPLGCEASNCVVATATAIQALDQNQDPAATSAPVPGGPSSSAPQIVYLPSGAYAVVVRSKDGHIYQSTYSHKTFSPWRNEGGTTMDGSNFGCVGHNEHATCFVQALDGRIYWKRLSAASGL